jgi:glycosyltransferase involved in cell wall biosynthesis
MMKLRTSINVFHGPENIGGIGRKLADWQRDRRSVVSDFIVFSDNTSFQNSHQNLHLEQIGLLRRTVIQLKFLVSAIKKYDVFNFYFGKSFLPFNLDLPILKLLGKKVIMFYVGSDVRLTCIEMNRNAYFHHRKKFEKKHAPPDWLKVFRMLWHNLWCDRCIAPRSVASYVTRFYKKSKVISNLWIVNAFDVPEIPPQPTNHSIPLIIHAPTSPERKGSRFVQAAVDELRKSGYQFEYKLVIKHDHQELIGILRDQADIVVDQLLSGDFGNLAVESLSFGKIVCGNVSNELRKDIPDLPIIQVAPDTLKGTLEYLITHWNEYDDYARKSWEFARENFDQEKLNSRLWDLYLELVR